MGPSRKVLGMATGKGCVTSVLHERKSLTLLPVPENRDQGRLQRKLRVWFCFPGSEPFQRPARPMADAGRTYWIQGGMLMMLDPEMCPQPHSSHPERSIPSRSVCKVLQ